MNGFPEMWNRENYRTLSTLPTVISISVSVFSKSSFHQDELINIGFRHFSRSTLEEFIY